MASYQRYNALKESTIARANCEVQKIWTRIRYNRDEVVDGLRNYRVPVGIGAGILSC